MINYYLADRIAFNSNIQMFLMKKYMMLLIAKQGKCSECGMELTKKDDNQQEVEIRKH